MTRPEDILAFWLDEVGPKGWYGGGADLDAKVRDRFQDTWKAAQDGGLSLWLTYPGGALAYIILNDQLPRNMFRDDVQAFASDPLALAAAKSAIGRQWDRRIDAPARQFFFLPLMHSENLSDQDRCVRLFLTRMPDRGGDNLLHARAHREVIRRFGRFPFRNEALSRVDRPSEIAFKERGGYGKIVHELEQS